MITRRTFGLSLAGATATLATGLGAQAAASFDVGFKAYAMRSQWHPILALGNWPLDHTPVSTSTGTQYGCFGRTYSDAPGEASLIASGTGDEAWAHAIAGPDGHAGIEHGLNGVCDQCSNRILLPANIDVRNSPGNEVATLFCGIYGLGIEELIVRIKDAAVAVNKDFPKRIPDQAVDDVVARVSGGLKDELALVRYDMERIIKPAVGPKYDELKTDIESVYLSFYYKRTALYHAYQRGNLGKTTLVPLTLSSRFSIASRIPSFGDAGGVEAQLPASPTLCPTA